MTKVKICGLTNLDDALKAEDLGADFLGFIFFKNSPRHISPDSIRDIIENLHGSAQKVGLFCDQDVNFVRVQADNCRLDLIQLHGNESPDYTETLRKDIRIIKSFKIKKNFDFGILQRYEKADFYLFDTYKEGMPGGTGVSFDWGMLEGKSFNKPIFLAGGLRPNNVKKAIEAVRPFAVDVASGIEKSPGKKDHRLLEEFITAVKRRN